MAKSVILTGAHIKLFIGGTLYNEVQSISVNISYAETPIYGIDSSLPQEIVSGNISVDGQVTGVYVKQSNGLQGKNIMTKLKDKMSQSYVSLEIRDRATDDKVLFIPQIKISNEQYSIAAKSAIKYSFSFSGIMPLTSADYS
jgi:hypothetical protein